MPRFATIIVTISLSLIFASHAAKTRSSGLSPNHPPVAIDDSYTVHGATNIGPMLQNDYDLDGDPLSLNVLSYTTHGHFGPAWWRPDGRTYFPDSGFVGTDFFTYQACDPPGLCTSATVTLNVVNNAPVAADDSYTVHGSTNVGPMLQNDYDSDGDSISFNGIITNPTQGQFGPVWWRPDGRTYIPNYGYAGADSFTYKICDYLGLCSTASVALNVVNSAPVTNDEYYVVRGSITMGPLLANDSDADGDRLSLGDTYHLGIITFPEHGNLYGTNAPDIRIYVPFQGYAGSDSLTYNVCDNLGMCSTATVRLTIVPNDGLENGGAGFCRSAVGQPINVTNGNMYLQQSDYSLPGIGPAINIVRTYNSIAQRLGLFGKGWSTTYDESIVVYSSTYVRWFTPDGQATNFTSSSSSGPFIPLESDFHGSLVRNGDGSFLLSLKGGSVHRFNSSGKLIALTDRIGNQTSLTYDINGRLISITDPFGRVLTVIPDANGRVTSVSDSLGTIASYTYGAGGELLSVSYPDTSGYHFSYTTANGNLVLASVTDALGNVLESHTYDAQGHALTSERQGGVERVALSFVSDTETDVTDALGHQTKYFFDKTKGRNVVSSVQGLCSCGSGSQTQSWTYDNQLNVTSKTDALNHTTSYTYDGNGNRLTETDTTGTVTYTYNQFAEVLTRNDQLNGMTTNTYDGQGSLLTTTNALNNTTTFSYNTRGQVLTATDARGKTSNFTYDASGNLTQLRDANSITTFFFYDARSRLTKLRDGLSRSTLYGYDAAGRINKVTHPDNSFVTFNYDLAGRRTRATDERGNPTNYAYDGAYRLTGVTDAANQTTTYGYDAVSNLTIVTDALSRVTNYDYDDFNRLIKITYPPATPGATRLFEARAYDAKGNVTQRTDTAGRINSYAYDNADRVTGITDADNKTTSFQYDALSRVTAVVDALNQQYQFAYDALGQQTQITRAGVSMNYAYDAVGNRSVRTDYKGVVTHYAYDNLNRLTTTVYPTRTVTRSYDSLNNLTRATNESGSIYIGYDNRYRISSFSDPFFYGISYNYDTVGNRTKLNVNGSTYATYTYDAVNRLTSLKDGANLNFTYSYDAANRLTSRNAPNGVASSYGYDGLNRLTSLMHTKGATLSGNLYSYSNANNIASWTTATAMRAYSYDVLDRLTGTSNFEMPTESYSYDAVGNRTGSHLSASYSYQPFNKLNSTANATYNYDNGGNLISRTDASGTTVFAYDEENRLTKVTLPTGLSVNYKYDALGRRIQRTTTAGASERYVYDGADVLLDLNADWSVAATYFNGPGTDNHLRQTNATTGVSYFLTDHLGSTSALTDASGNLVEETAYDSFGNSTGSARTRYTYTGRERDSDTGMLYYRARFYDPQIGRFISEDPIGFRSGDVNIYGYVWQNPLKYRDPRGLDGWGNDVADWLDQKIESLRRWLESDPDAINFNTVVNYATNYHGHADLLRVGTGVGHALSDSCSNPAEEILQDVGRASAIVLILAGPAAEILGASSAAADATAASRGGSGSTAISTIRQTAPGETFIHYGFADQAENFANGLRPGGYATNLEGLSGMEAKTGLSLRRAVPPDAMYRVTPRTGTLIDVNPIVRPQFGQPGGLREYYFPTGTGPGTVSGPFPIRPR